MDFLFDVCLTNNMLTVWQKFWMVIGVLGLVLVGWNYMYRPTGLTVVGEGKLSVVPEKVEMIATRVTANPDVTKAIDDNGLGIKALMDIARGIAGADTQIQKSFYQVTPQSGQYLVASAFSIKTSNVTQVNSLVKTLYQSGATSVTNVKFSASDQTATEQQARVLAVKDAKEKALKIAKAAGKRVGRLVSISDDNTVALSSVGTASVGTGTQISLGQIEIVKRVQVVYEVW